MYGKRDELATAANREFLEQYPKVFKALENILRFERESRNFIDLRRVVGGELESGQPSRFLGDDKRVYLRGLLLSPHNPVHELFETIAQPGANIEIFQTVEQLASMYSKPGQIIKELGYTTLARACATPEHVEAIAELITSNRAAKGNYRNEIMKRWISMQAELESDVSRAKQLRLVEAIKEQLRVAA